MVPLPTCLNHRLKQALLVAVFVVLSALTAACTAEVMNSSTATLTLSGSPCPIPTPNARPSGWLPQGTTAVPNRGIMMNADNDGEFECVIIYRYNVTGENQGVMGGVVLDPQPSTAHQAEMAVYRLLPWVNRPYVVTSTIPGSPPGYLGILGEKDHDVRLYDIDADGDADELGIVGSDLAGNKTNLSLYR